MKMEIINVDLGMAVDDIVADDINRLTSKNEADIEAIASATRQKIDRSHTKRAQTQMANEEVRLSKNEALQRSFDRLVAAGTEFLTLAELAEPAKPIFATNNSFITIFNRFLRSAHGGEYVLTKHQKAGKTVYQLRKFNLA